MLQGERLLCHAGPGYTRDYKGAADLPPEAAAAPLPAIPLPPFKATDVATGTPVQLLLTLLQRLDQRSSLQCCGHHSETHGLPCPTLSMPPRCQISYSGLCSPSAGILLRVRKHRLHVTGHAECLVAFHHGVQDPC